jgi:2-(1,2-epoxy-1,2-dihydrophenyl)acetyl-CoA isomerase
MSDGPHPVNFEGAERKAEAAIAVPAKHGDGIMEIELPVDRSYLVTIDSGVLTLSFNRPAQGNAMKTEMVAPLTTLFRQAQASPEVRAVLVRGEGGTFSAGGDVAGFAPTLERSVAERQAEFRGRIGRLGKLVEAVCAFEGPIVAAIGGAVAGAAMVFALGADHVIGNETALFVFAHIGIGLCPDGGVSALLAECVGARTARSLLLTGARVKAEEALRIGLLNRMVGAGELDAKALETARRLAAGPQQAMRHTKRLVREAGSSPLTEQLDAETAAIADCVGDEDFGEGVRAFLEKRKASFPSAR